MDTIVKKQPGRPPLLPEALRVRLAHLYFDLNLTAREIRALPEFLEVRSDQALRSMATTQRKRDIERRSA